MGDTEFKHWASIEKLDQMITVTEKVHGSNAQILVGDDLTVRAASRERWLDRVNDNFGFCRHVTEHAEEIGALLGPGRHYGEWYGAGIGSSYNLKEKRLALFDQRFTGKPLPSWCDVVPVLYSDFYSHDAITQALAKLKEGGSVIAPGFMRPEGVVVRWNRSGIYMKKVFEAEDSAWAGKREKDPTKDAENAAKKALLAELGAKYLQPIRLEKLLLADEQLKMGYPTTLPQIVKNYCADLEKETDDIDAESWKAAKKNLFGWVKQMIEVK